jgi:hypothetical protein
LGKRQFATSAPKCLMLGSVPLESNWAIWVHSALPWCRGRSNSRRCSCDDMNEEKGR